MTTPCQQVTRRRFLASTTLSAGGILLSGRIGLGADTLGSRLDYPSTDHFWYRLQPPGRYIDSQRGNKAFAYADGEIFLSKDNGHTWPRRLAFPEARRITFSHILKSGNILFATGSQLYLSTDNLKSSARLMRSMDPWGMTVASSGALPRTSPIPLCIRGCSIPRSNPAP